jgi:hypothetical protein
MEKEPKLKTKLDFQFNTKDLEIPILNFFSEEPIAKTDEVRILKKKKLKDKKPSTKLF